ncbi:MAG: stage II sporulation protein P [Eubacteriales bacterium]|nr:stage II sporulation protein P [Eubacteriales bacterium]
MSELLRGMLLVLTAFLNMGLPETGQPVPVCDRDPSYAVYQKYRYAYDTYGYLFLRGEAGDGGSIGADDGMYFGVAVGEEAGGTGGAGSGEMAGGSPGAESGSLPETEAGGATGTDPGEAATEALLAGGSGTAPALAQLQDYDYLMKHFYSVHASTTADRELMRAETLMGTDMKLSQDGTVPQILIYHTHSQETYADYGPGNQEATIVSAGSYLAELLRQKGWNVIHDTGTYDIQGGKLDRSRAYNYALDGITGILQKNPTIQVILDLHRDGVKAGTRLVTTVNGKPTANIMFFQGMSRTPEETIEYLPNPYLQENLAFAFQMQYLAAGRYPGYTRKIYLKGLRYNLHLRPRSALIEVGAQTNTLKEALNAMEPLAELLDTVLHGE